MDPLDPNAVEPGYAALLIVALGVVLFLGSIGLWVWTLVDALKHPNENYEAVGQSKTVWVLVVVFLGLLGSVIYLAVVRGQLRRLAGSRRETAINP